MDQESFEFPVKNIRGDFRFMHLKKTFYHFPPRCAVAPLYKTYVKFDKTLAARK